MNAVTLLQHVEDYLAPLVEEEDKGIFSIAADPEEALEMLAGNAPTRWRLVLIFAGYDPIQQDDGDDSFADAVLKLYAQLPASFGSRPTGELHRTQPGGTPPMLERIEKVSFWLRALRLDVRGLDCRQFRFQGSEWEAETKSGKALTRTHRLDFRVTVALDVPARPSAWQG